MIKLVPWKKRIIPFLMLLICLGLAVTVSADLSTDRTLYTVANAHLDTQWNWNIQTTINNYLTKTVDSNEALFVKYPNYNFNFEGAFRYALIKEYWPDRWNTMKNRIAQGRWNVAGSSWENGDVNIPSPETLFRNILYGNGFFRQEFGKTSQDIFLPDCFGFGYALPSIIAHAGLKGFSTQKLSWGSAYGIPFDIGRWIGPDGSYVAAALNPGSYTTSFSGDLSNNSTWLNKINANGAYGVYAGYGYHGTGDTGGSPSDSSAAAVNSSVNGTGPIKVLSASTDQLFKDLTPSQLLGLPSYNGELVMTTHGVGSYTSRTITKRWNRKNELLADAAERSSVVADWLGGAQYPLERLSNAWKRFIQHTFHDTITGTSVYTAYGFAYNDYVLSLNQFAGELANGVGAVTRAMDTQVTGIPVVIYNPLALARKDVVEARVNFPGGVPAAVRVFDPSGAEVPSQLGEVSGNYATVIFLADMPSLGFKTYDVRSSDTPCTIGTGLSVTSTTLNSNRYTVTINSNGDISSIIDKQNGNRQLLSAPMRLQMQNDNSQSWPSWEILYSDVNSNPREYVSGSVVTTIVENGPARVALKVTRTQAGSNFNQIIRLNAGGDADRIEIDNDVNWQTPSTLLKATFPLGVSNAQATYDLGLGTIRRGNNTSALYEVPAQQWADITDTGNTYGVSIMNDCKVGWDKPNNNTLRLTLIHTPAYDYGSNGQRRQDFGKNLFKYAVYGHAGDWKTGGTVAQAARLNQPLLAFQTIKHSGVLGKSYSFMSINAPQVQVKAVKKAENSNEIIVRVHETSGVSVANVQLTVGSGITSAREVNGFEDPVGSATVSGGKLQFNIGAYQPKTFALTLAGPPTAVSAPVSQTVPLSYNKDVVSPDSNRGDGNFDGIYAIPAELFPETVTAEGIKFVLGPKTNGAANALVAGGQSITLNNTSGYKRLYFLAGSINGDITANFTINGTPVSLTIQDMKANVGQWDLQSTTGPYTTIRIKRDPVAWVATHIHTSTANVAYKFAYLFKYRIDLPQGIANPVLVLPSNGNILIFAMTLSNNSNDDTVPAGYLYDYIDPASIPPTPTPTPAPGVNYALHKPATANQYVIGEEPALAVDGTVEGNSKWCSTGTGDKWLRLDLGQDTTINFWVVRHAGAGGENPAWNTRDFKLQRSSDGTTWIDVDSVTGNTADVTERTVAAFTSRYIRLYITKPTNNTDTAARIYELELYNSGVVTPTPTPPPSANLALNKTATANQYVTGEEPFKAVDGTTANNSKWCSTAAGDKWLRIDLGQNYTINRWVVKHAGAGGETTAWNTRDFKLQRSSDGTNWIDVDTVTGNTANVTDRTITAFTSRYVRLYITRPTNSTDTAARIYELELYNSGTVTPTPTPVNLALNKTATANQYVTNEQPFKAVDGTTANNSKWCSTAAGDKWLRVDLGQNYTINRWVVKHAGAGGETTAWNTRDFKLQRSSDGTNWVDVDLVTGNTANITDRNVTPFTSRYVRLYITVPTQNGNTAARIYEFEVYGN